jgi:hypothetical protein
MKPACYLLIAGTLLGAACKAQDVKRNSIELSSGVGIPVGVFASKDPRSIKSGLAQRGLAINLEYSHSFKGKLAVYGGFKRNIFPLDVAALYKSAGNVTFASSDPWRVNVVYAGLSRMKQVDDKIILNYKAAVGLATSRYPESTIVISNSSSTHITSDTGSAVAFIVGATLKYVFTEKIHLALKADYLSTSPKFFVNQTTTIGLSQRQYNSKYTQNMQAITAGVSVLYNF